MLIGLTFDTRFWGRMEGSDRRNVDSTSDPLLIHFDVTSISQRILTNVTSISLRAHAVFTSISLQVHIDVTSISLRFRFDITPRSLPCDFDFTSMPLMPLRLRFDVISIPRWRHFGASSISLSFHAGATSI